MALPPTIKFKTNYLGRAHSLRDTDLERGYGDVQPWRPPFHASPVVHEGPISSKSASSQDPLLRIFGILASTASIFAQILAHKLPNLEIFSSQAPKFGNFQFTSSQIWKFSVHQLPFQRQISVRKPHTSNIWAAHPYLKKSWVPPLPGGGGAQTVATICDAPKVLFFNRFWSKKMNCCLKDICDHNNRLCLSQITYMPPSPVICPYWHKHMRKAGESTYGSIAG